MALPVVKVSHLTKSFKDILAVDDLSFELNRGEVYGFLGQNGAGKSTTIRMLLTLVTPTSGQIEMFGQDLSVYRREILRKIGAVIERPDLYKYLTALEQLALFAKMNGLRLKKQDLMARLEQVGLHLRAGSKVKTFSQGMKQRLGLAIALVHDPELLLLDEPTNGLDPQGIAEVRQLLIRLSRDQGVTILISSHILHEVEWIADRMLIIDRGKKISEGNVKELFNTHTMQVDLEVANGPALLEKIRDTRWHSQLVYARGQHLHFQMDKADIPALVHDMVHWQVPVLSIRPRYSLEDQFLQLTGTQAHANPYSN